jgi:stage II sporulation protein P
LIQQRAEEIYPDLMRPILMRSSLYNQDLCNGGILVEIGTCGNTFTEALLGAECFTECLRDVLDILCEG